MREERSAGVDHTVFFYGKKIIGEEGEERGGDCGWGVRSIRD